MDPRRHQAYRALIDTVRALLDGRMTRTQAKAWIRETTEDRRASSGIAATVFNSLWNIDERDDRGELVRESDLRAYLDWLTRGDCFDGDEQPLVGLAGDIEQLAEGAGSSAISARDRVAAEPPRKST